jgi:NodT family efflux transporter outer membrane factor (OMF) lipoprotein
MNVIIRFPLCAALVVAAIAAVWLAGCAAPAGHTAWPSPELPARWMAASQASGENLDSSASGAGAVVPPEVAGAASPAARGGRWWHAFGDDALNALVDEALANNADLAVAAIRVRRAQLEAGLVGAETGPRANLTGTANVGRAFDAEGVRRSSGVNAALSYELDLWGKLAARRDEAAWRTQASEADREAAALLLIGTTSKLYWRIGYLNESIAFAEASIADAQRTSALLEARAAAGAATPADVARARQQLAVLRAEQAKSQLERESERNALALLLNRRPDEQGTYEQGLFGTPVPGVQAGLPANVLSRRPDLRAAESRLRARLAHVDFARAALYPDLALTAELGTRSEGLVRLLQNPIASVGTAIALPFIQWNTVRLKVALSETEFEEASIDFRKQIYQALADVETALAAKTQLDAAARQRARAFEQATLAATSARARFELGATDATPWLDAQHGQRLARVDQLANRLARLENRIDLFLALGGG